MFCGFAIGSTVGLGAFSGGAVRYRLYSAAGLSPGQIARVIFFIAIAYGIGLATITALGLALRAEEVSRLLGAPSVPLRSAAAVILALAIIFLSFCAVRRKPLRLGPVEFASPGAHLVLIQIGLTALDILAAATALWVLLPAADTSFIAFAAVYAAALTLGVLSHLPGGLGVFEVAILLAIGNKAPPSSVAAALIVYRAIYFLLPLLLATVLLASFEARRARQRDRSACQSCRRAAGTLIHRGCHFWCRRHACRVRGNARLYRSASDFAGQRTALGGRDFAPVQQHCGAGPAFYRAWPLSSA